jgi:hypothetical protein
MNKEDNMLKGFPETSIGDEPYDPEAFPNMDAEDPGQHNDPTIRATVERSTKQLLNSHANGTEGPVIEQLMKRQNEEELHDAGSNNGDEIVKRKRNDDLLKLAKEEMKDEKREWTEQEKFDP